MIGLGDDIAACGTSGDISGQGLSDCLEVMLGEEIICRSQWCKDLLTINLWLGKR